MLRTATRPRWLAALAVLGVVVYIFIRLGLWQFHTGQSRAMDDLSARSELPPQPIGTLVEPQQPFRGDLSGRMVDVRGRYDASGQVLVTGRRLDDAQGYWVVTPLIEERTGARLPILRGFVTDPSQADRPDSQPVKITGALAQPEAPSDLTALPEGQLTSVDVAWLVNHWGGRVYNAFVFATQEEPRVSAAPVRPVPPPVTHMTGLNWRNLGYAVQWWVFALFACFIVWRQLRDDAERDSLAREESLEPPEEPPVSGIPIHGAPAAPTTPDRGATR